MKNNSCELCFPSRTSYLCLLIEFAVMFRLKQELMSVDFILFYPSQFLPLPTLATLVLASPVDIHCMSLPLCLRLSCFLSLECLLSYPLPLRDISFHAPIIQCSLCYSICYMSCFPDFLISAGAKTVSHSTLYSQHHICLANSKH